MNEYPFKVELVRANRKKSASITVQDDIVVVSVPKELSEYRIKKLIKDKTPWIRLKLKECKPNFSIPSKEYVSGETISYLGRNYKLKIIEGNQASIKLKGQYLLTTITDKSSHNDVYSLIQSWYISHATEKLMEKTNRLAKAIGVKPISIKVKNYKSRWGSCSSKGDVSYNWKIMQAPSSVIDYVVIHELCHLIEHNHSSKFWNMVEKYCPEWKKSKEWLKRNSMQLLALDKV